MASGPSREKSGALVFTYHDYIHLPAADLALDPPRRSTFAAVSHGHSDHIARHLAGIATPATTALVARRLGTCRLTPVEYGESIERQEHRISFEPAGHVLGAAQVVVDAPDGCRLVYTGDFSVRPRQTVRPAVPIRADVLIMECTFGQPRYVFPSDDEIRERIREFIDRALADSLTPVLLGYALGKAQEAMALVGGMGYSVRVHPAVAELAEVYRNFGIALGTYSVFDGDVAPGQVLIAPPSARGIKLPHRCRTLYLSGWALDRSARYRLGVDDAIPLSDHADFAELVAFVAEVQPGRVYTTHGPSAFADHLRRLGFNAEHLGTHQPMLF